MELLPGNELHELSGYSRDTELRNVQPNDLYRLAVILDEDDYWKKLMEMIPKELNNQIFGNSADIARVFSTLPASERKYDRDQIRLVEKAFKRSGESRLCPQILFDEWGSSGRKYERPTLGVLLYLLLQARLFRAADFVAEALLKEPKPSRPADGPGAEITCDLPSSFFDEIHKMANESENYPDTEMLQQNANCVSSMMDINKDYYTKYREPFEKHFAPPIWSVNHNDGPPIPPPRLQKSARLQIKQQQSQLSLSSYQMQPTANKANHGIYTINELEPQQQPSNLEIATATTTNDIPKISLLMNASSSSMEESTNDSSIAFGDSLPKLSFLRGNSNRNLEMSEDIYSSNSIPNIIYTDNINIHQSVNDADSHVNHDLPAISALNLNGERDTGTSRPMSNVENVPSVALNLYATNSEKSNADIDFNVPSVVANTARDEHLKQPNDGAIEVNVNGVNNYFGSNFDIGHNDDYEDDIEEENDDDDDDDDDDDVPNLSIFNDSSLTSVTNTSGDNSFEHTVNESRPASADSVPNVFN